MLIRRRKRRVSAGAIAVWGAAFDEVRYRRRSLLSMALFAVAVLAIANIPWLPPYERGFLTGFILVGTAWMFAWVVWVLSGHSLRLNGVWAEQGVHEQISKHDRVFNAIPSLKFNRFDVDTVAVTSSHVLAVETKWHMSDLDDGYLRGVAQQAARGCRSLRFQLDNKEFSRDLVLPLVVLCGRKVGDLQPRVVNCQAGSVQQVTVLGVDYLDEWLDRQPAGLIGQDFAEKILTELDVIARQRDRTAVSAGRFRRSLARIH